MKRLLTIIIIMFAIDASAQTWPIDKETNKFTFTEVINVDSATKNDLYLRAREWFAKTYNNSKEVIQVDDKDAGKIYGRGAISVFVTQIGIPHDNGLVYYDISINVKDGRYKYTLTNFYHDATTAEKGVGSGGALENEKPACGGWGMFQKSWDTIKSKSNAKTLLIIDDLKQYMAKAKPSPKETW